MFRVSNSNYRSLENYKIENNDLEKFQGDLDKWKVVVVQIDGKNLKVVKCGSLQTGILKILNFLRQGWLLNQFVKAFRSEFKNTTEIKVCRGKDDPAFKDAIVKAFKLAIPGGQATQPKEIKPSTSTFSVKQPVASSGLSSPRKALPLNMSAMEKSVRDLPQIKKILDSPDTTKEQRDKLEQISKLYFGKHLEFNYSDPRRWFIQFDIQYFISALKEKYSKFEVVDAHLYEESEIKYLKTQVKDARTRCGPEKTQFPVMILAGEDHYTCAFFDFTTNTLEYYDSKMDYARTKKGISRELKKLAKKFGLKFVDKNRDKILQFDSYQCGAWICHFLEQRVKDPDFEPKPIDIAQDRKKILADIIRHRYESETNTMKYAVRESPQISEILYTPRTSDKNSKTEQARKKLNKTISKYFSKGCSDRRDFFNMKNTKRARKTEWTTFTSFIGENSQVASMGPWTFGAGSEHEIGDFKLDKIKEEGKTQFPMLINPIDNYYAIAFADTEKGTLEYYGSKADYGNKSSTVEDLKKVANNLGLNFVEKTNEHSRADSYQCFPWACYFLKQRAKNPNYDPNSDPKALNAKETAGMIAEYRIEVLVNIILFRYKAAFSV